MKRLKIFTWHVHGAYLLYLAEVPHDIYIPVKPSGQKGAGYLGKVGAISRRDNIHEIPLDDIHGFDFDCIIFQSKYDYLCERFNIFTDKQLALPKIFLEHDPPREHPTDTKHFVEPDTFLVHVTQFNSLMWDSGVDTEKRVIEHGVFIPEELPSIRRESRASGITVINQLRNRSRRLGCDIFLEARKQVPIDLIGMDAESVGGVGEIAHHELPNFIAQYRYLFHPVRYTSLALAVCEAMSVGLPIIGLATTELPTVIQNAEAGYLSNNLNELIPIMQELNSSWGLAERWGTAARRIAKERFNITRFAKEWDEVLLTVTG